MARILFTAATGPQDPTRASLAFHIGANGAGATATEYAIVLAGDGTELIKPGVAESVKGVGIPPLAELLARCLAQGARFYV